MKQGKIIIMREILEILRDIVVANRREFGKNFSEYILRKIDAIENKLNSEPKVQGSDTTDDDSSTGDGNQKDI